MKPTYTDLENDIREMDATIDGLTAAIADLETDVARTRDKLTEAIDLVWRLGGSSVRDLDENVNSLLDVLETARAAL